LRRVVCYQVIDRFASFNSYMMTFAQTWERQERVRHQTLLQQLKAELAAKGEATTAVAPLLYSAVSPTAHLVSRPKPNKPRRETQALLASVAIR
jgi:hypothetical protein